MSAEDIIIKLKRGVSGGAQPSGLTHGELAINTTDVRLYVGSLTGSTVAVNNRFFSGAATPAYPIEGDRWHNGSFESVYLSGYWLPTSGTTGTFNPANLLLFAAGASGTGGITFSGNVTITNTLGGSTNILNGLTVQGGITGTLLTTQQQNVTLLGTLSSLTASGLVSANAGLSASSIFVSNGATFNGNISAPNIVNSVNDITGQASITSGSNIIITQSGKQITIAAAATPAVVATSSVTGVASFRAADFDVSATGSVSLTGNVARTHIGQTFTGLQVFSSGLSANGLTGTILTPSQTNITAVGTLTSLNSAGLTSTQRVTISSGGLSVAGNIDGTIGTVAQPNITSLGTLTSLNSAGLTSTQRVNVSAGGIVVQAGGLSVTGGANLTGGSIFFGDIEVYDGAFIRTGGLSVTGGIAGTLLTAAQTNITSVGVLSGLSVNNGLSVTGGISATGGVNIGGGGISVTGGIAGTVLTPAQPNITSVGTLTSLNSTGLITTTSGLSANNINIASGATFGGAVRIFGDLLVSGGITTTISENVLIEDNYIILNSNATVADSGGIEVYRGLGNTNRVIRWNESSSAWQFTNDGTNYLNIGAVGSLPIATASTTGVAFFPHTDFSVTSLGGVSLTGNVARTHIGQTFTGLQVFSSGLSANGFTGTLNTAAQPNITSVGTLTSLNTAGLTSTQRVNVSSGGIVVQAGGLSVTGGISATGGANFYGLVGINASGGVVQDNLMVQGNYGLYGISQHVGGTSQYFNIRSSHASGNVVGYHRYDIWPWGSVISTWLGRAYGGSDTQNAYTSNVVDDTTGYPNQNTHTTFNVRDFGARSDAVIYIGSGSSGGNTRPSLYAEQGAVLAASGGTVGIGTNSPSAKLDVNGTFRASSNATLLGGLTANNLFVSQGTTFASGIAITRGGSEFGTVRLDTGNNLLYNSWNGHIFQNGSVERLRIDPTSGFVGIGTNSPTQAIDISGNAAVRGSLFVANGVSVTGGITGTLLTSTQPNVTQVGSLISLTAAGITSSERINVSSGGIVVQAGGLSVTGGLHVTGVAFFQGATNLYVNTFVRSGGISVTGGIAGTLITQSQTNITSVGTLTSLNTAGLTSTQRVTISSGGLSVAGGIDGTINTASQPNITLVGSLVSLTSAGATFSERVNITNGGLSAAGPVFIQSNGLSVTGGIAGTLLTASQPNVTSVGVLNGLSVNNGLSVTGGISATGGMNIGGGGLSVTGGIAGTIVTPSQTNITAVGVLNGLSVNNGLSVTGGLNVTGPAFFGSNVTVNGDISFNYISASVGVSANGLFAYGATFAGTLVAVRPDSPGDATTQISHRSITAHNLRVSSLITSGLQTLGPTGVVNISSNSVFIGGTSVDVGPINVFSPSLTGRSVTFKDAIVTISGPNYSRGYLYINRPSVATGNTVDFTTGLIADGTSLFRYGNFDVGRPMDTPNYDGFPASGLTYPGWWAYDANFYLPSIFHDDTDFNQPVTMTREIGYFNGSYRLTDIGLSGGITSISNRVYEFTPLTIRQAFAFNIDHGFSENPGLGFVAPRGLAHIGYSHNAGMGIYEYPVVSLAVGTTGPTSVIGMIVHTGGIEVTGNANFNQDLTIRGNLTVLGSYPGSTGSASPGVTSLNGLIGSITITGGPGVGISNVGLDTIRVDFVGSGSFTGGTEFYGGIKVRSGGISVTGGMNVAQGSTLTGGAVVYGDIEVYDGGFVRSGGLSVTGGIAGTIVTPSQPNITSLGTLQGLSSAGGITGGNGLFIRGGPVNIEGQSINVYERFGAGGSLQVSGSTRSSIRGGLDIGGSVTITGNVSITGNVTITDALNVLNKVAITGGLELTGDAFISRKLFVNTRNTTTTDDRAVMVLRSGTTGNILLLHGGAGITAGLGFGIRGGAGALEFTNTDTAGNQASRFSIGSASDTTNILIYSGARGSEYQIASFVGASRSVGIGQGPGSVLATLDVSGDALIRNGLSVTGNINSSDTIYSQAGYEIGSSTFVGLTQGYTLVASDDGKVITFNSATPVTLTGGTAVGFTGFSCTIIQLGAGQVTVRPSSVTINSFASATKLAGQHSAATLLCYSTNTFNLSGNLTT